MPSSLVEYLSNQLKDGGEPLAYQSGSATFVPSFPANTVTTFLLGPGEGEFAFLLYKVLWDPANVPQAFTIYAQHRGIRPFDGIVHQIFGVNGVDGWLIVTEAQKLLVRVSNNSNLNQRLSYGYQWLTIKTREDFDLVSAAVARYASSGREEITQTNKLMAELIAVAKRPEPRPPL